MQSSSNSYNDLEQILEINQPTKVIRNLKLHQKEKPLIIIDEEISIQQQDALLIVRKVYDSSQIEISDDLLLVIQKAQKQPNSHFLIIKASQRLTTDFIYLYLYDHYSNLRFIREGMQIYISGEIIDGNIMIFTARMTSNNFFIIEPEVLTAPSTLSGLQYCRRKGFIKEFIQNQCFGTTIEMLGGTIVHEFFQSLIENPKQYQDLFDCVSTLDLLSEKISELQIQDYPIPFIDVIKKFYIKYLESFYYLGKMELKDLILKIYQSCLNSIHWIDQYILKQKPLIIKQYREEFQIYFTKWEKNEQTISSSIYGLKGFLDVVVHAKYKVNNSEFQECLMPIELKAGQQQQYYEQQVQIYLLLMSKHYQQNIQLGLLLYLSKLDTQLITCNNLQKNSVIFTRNLYQSQIYQFEKHTDCYSSLPEINDFIQSERDANYKCSKCDFQSVCYGLNILTEQQDPIIRLPEYQRIKSQLQQKSKAYLNKMLASLRQEEQANILPQAIYCIKQIINEPTSVHYVLQSKGYFLKQQASDIISRSFQENKITLFSIKSQKNQKFLFKNATLMRVGEIISIVDDSEGSQQNEIENEDNFEYAIQLNVFQEKSIQELEDMVLSSDDNLIYKFFQKNSFKYFKQVIFDLTINDAFFSRKKDILLFGVEPQFKPENELEDERKYSLDILTHKLKDSLNEDQFEAIKLGIQAEDFALIQGYPGTGKTHTLSYLLYLLGYINKKVLVCTYTHSALDNLLEKFVSEFPLQANWVVRLASKQDKISSVAQKYHFAFKDYTNLKEVEKVLENKQLFFSTCLSCVDVIQSQEFDYCIVEEASQIIEPLCISCILRSKVFILIGDYKQLQPLVKSSRAQLLRKSLLQRLDEDFKKVKCSKSLTIQYRMNQQIMKIANNLVYDGQLKLCKESQNEGLQLSKIAKDFTCFEKSLHYQNQSVLFLQTKQQSDEITYACAVINFFLQHCLEISQILMITTYNRLITLLQDALEKRNIHQLSIITIDKSQGRDADCIIVICSEQEQGKYHLLQNISRINVACTRAKKKLIIIGNSKYLDQLESAEQLMRLLEQEGWIFQVDEKFLKKYS